ncbi:phage minor head protein [Exiguobacterium oxidotolerans]|uniref:phage minor head protein n=1 Tax=Exiguobacterium oxidotolerans TaxID=223958 RepID=UPI0004940689|nr:phage minor head protein [Exiguobacterium oxidotolerans]
MLQPKQAPFAPTEKQIEQRIKVLYRDAYRDIQRTIATMYEQYSRDGELSLADMTRYNRLSNVERELAQLLSQLYINNKRYLYETLEAAYLHGYFEQQYKLEMAAQQALGSGGVNEKAVQAMIAESLTGLVLDERLGENQRLAVNQMRQALSYSLVQGESYVKAAKRIKETLGKDQARSVLVAWTETHRAYETASHDSREQAKADGLVFETAWLATLDKRTRQRHRAMDGKTQDADGYFSLPGGSKGRYPGDPMLGASDVIRCRCTTVTNFVDRLPGSRRGRSEYDDARSPNDLFNGKTTYKDWYASRLE